jgi:hypothetical protein
VSGSHLCRVLPLFGLLSFGFVSPAASNPTLVGDMTDAGCSEALHLATAAFESASGSLLWPIAAPAHGATSMALRRDARDISGGRALVADPRAFAEIRQQLRNDYEITTYWGKHTSGGYRLVVTDEPFNWRGDWYYVFLVPSDLTLEQFAEQRDDEHTSLKGLLGESRSNPPIVLQDTLSQAYWLIDRGEAYEVMADWKVLVPEKSALRTACEISFSAPTLEDTAALSAVRSLAAALDEALGPGTGEGTLHQTARIRIEVEREWANALARPWALTDAPYNTRAEVESGLKDWASANRTRAKLLRRIHALYPKAERELTSFYATKFKKPRAAAESLSRKALDHMFRSYFVFSKGR